MYMALLDSYMALKLDKNHMKSLFRLARCLHELKWHEEAKECLEMFCKRNPDYANSQICETLTNDINTALETKRKNEENLKKKSNSTQTRNLDDTSESESDNDKKGKPSDNEEEVVRKKRCDDNNNTSTIENNIKMANKEKIKKKIETDYSKAKEEAIDFKSRFCGHCNVATDIKEANFIGE